MSEDMSSSDEDRSIIEACGLGWMDSSYERANNQQTSILLSKAYNIGTAHFRVGDDFRLVDYYSDQQTIDLIKKENA